MPSLSFIWLTLFSFVFFALAGLLSGWLDRKLTARLQWRVGPPWWQNFADLLKLFGKEVVVPETAGPLFLLAPFLAVASVTITGALLLSSIWRFPFSVDLILMIYLLMLPSLFLIAGGSSSSNPLAGVGAGRELKLLLSYELPFIISLLIPVVKTGSSSLTDIFQKQLVEGMTARSPSGLIAFLVALLSFQAKIGQVPFDVSEAEGEIASGVLIEYSGLPLAFFKLARWMLLSVGITFLVFYFCSGMAGRLTAIIKYLIVLVLIVLVKNTNPRLRIDQAMKFFWGWLSLFAMTAILLSFMGW